MHFDLNQVCQICFYSIVHNDINRLVMEAYNLTKIPVMVESISHRFIAACPKIIENDEIWNSIYKNGAASSDLILTLQLDDTFKKVGSSSKAVYVDWGLYAATNATPRIVCNMLFESKRYGIMLAACPRDKYTDELAKVIEIFAQTAAIIVSKLPNAQNSNNARDPRSFLYSTFTRELFNNAFSSKFKLNQWCDILGLNIAPPYRIIAVQTCFSDNKEFIIQKTLDDLREMFPFNPIMYKDDAILVFEYGNTPDKGQLCEEKLLLYLHKNNAIASSSCSFEDINKIKSYCRQAKDALIIAHKLKQENKIYSFSDYVLPIVLSYSVDSEYIHALCHPAITELMKFDKENNTEYFETLKIYIKNMCDSGRVSKTMHIHRNTLLYRINKIEEMTGLDIMNFETFTWLLCSILAYEQIKNKKH